MASEAVAVPAARPDDQARRGPARSAALSAALVYGPVIAVYVVGAMLITAHLWANPAGLEVAGNPWDQDQYAWYMRYTATAIAHGQLPDLTTTALNAPRGVAVLWNTFVIPAAIVLSPVTWLAGPQVSLTVMLTAGFAASAASMLFVLRRWGFRLGPAGLAGAVYGFSPALVHSAIGHYDIQFAVLPPLLVDAGLRLFIRPAAAGPGGAGGACGPGGADVAAVAWAGAVRRASRRDAIIAGAWLGLLAAIQLYMFEETLAMSAITGILLALILVLARPLRLARSVARFTRGGLAGLASQARAAAAVAAGVAARPAVGLGLAVLVFGSIAGAGLVSQFAGPLAQHGFPFLADYYKNDLITFVQPSSFVLWHTAASVLATSVLPGGPAEQLGYLGWSLIGLLTVGTVWFWRYRLVSAIAPTVVILELLSLGAHPQIDGSIMPGLVMPWNWFTGLPLIGMAIPDRFSIFADGLITVLLALITQRLFDLMRERDGLADPGIPLRALRRRAGIAAGLAAVALSVLTLVPAPLQTDPVPVLPAGWTATFASLRLSPGATVLVVPVPVNGLTNAMRWQATSGTRISLIGGYFLGPDQTGEASIGGTGLRPTAAYLNTLWLASPAGQPWAWAVPTPATPPPLAGQATADLAYWKASAVVAQASPGTDLARYLERTLGPPRVVTGALMAWRLG